MSIPKGKLVVISGPSGVGKSSIVREALKETNASFSVSATTRKPRSGEIDGRDYKFMNRKTFKEMISSGKLLEWAKVFDELYGTPAEPVRQAMASGGVVLLDIDVQGAMQVHSTMPDATFVLIIPPSDEELAARLRGRGGESDTSLNLRLGKARQEIQTARQSGVYNHIVVNDDLTNAVRQVVNIINSA